MTGFLYWNSSGCLNNLNSFAKHSFEEVCPSHIILLESHWNSIEFECDSALTLSVTLFPLELNLLETYSAKPRRNKSCAQWRVDGAHLCPDMYEHNIYFQFNQSKYLCWCTWHKHPCICNLVVRSFVSAVLRHNNNSHKTKNGSQLLHFLLFFVWFVDSIASFLLNKIELHDWFDNNNIMDQSAIRT